MWEAYELEYIDSSSTTVITPPKDFNELSVTAPLVTSS
jgi:hypothetical protein